MFSLTKKNCKCVLVQCSGKFIHVNLQLKLELLKITPLTICYPLISPVGAMPSVRLWRPVPRLRLLVKRNPPLKHHPVFFFSRLWVSTLKTCDADYGSSSPEKKAWTTEELPGKWGCSFFVPLLVHYILVTINTHFSSVSLLFLPCSSLKSSLNVGIHSI